MSYETLLGHFWKMHDPSSVGGGQYRAAVFTLTPEQAATAQASKAALEASGTLRRPVGTEITPASRYYLAEDYHQQYMTKRRSGLSRWF